MLAILLTVSSLLYYISDPTISSNLISPHLELIHKHCTSLLYTLSVIICSPDKFEDTKPNNFKSKQIRFDMTWQTMLPLHHFGIRCYGNKTSISLFQSILSLPNPPWLFIVQVEYLSLALSFSLSLSLSLSHSLSPTLSLCIL